MDRFRELEAFVTVVEAGSFVAAAEVLRTSKAALSRLVQDLEARLGARLLHRTTRRLSLTEAGRVYYERGRQIMDDLGEADSVVGLTSTRAVGLLKIAAPLSFGVQHLAPVWGGFLEANPEVTLDISLNDRLVDLVEEGYDAAVRISRMGDSSLVSRRLASTRMVLCAAPAYLDRAGTPATAEDLAQHQVIGYSYSASGDTWHLVGPSGPVSVATRPRLRANNGDTCVGAALAGQGIIFQPTFLVGEALAAGLLRPILPEYSGPDLGIHFVYPSRKHLSGKVRAMGEYLAAYFERPRWEDCPAKRRERLQEQAGGAGRDSAG